VSDYQNRLDSFGRQLSAAAEGPAAAAGRSWRLVAAGGGAVAVAVAAVWVVALGGAGDRLSFTEQAQAALAPDGKVVHAVLRSFAVRRPGYEGRRPAADTTETWSATDPARWRMVQHLSKQGAGRYFGRLEVAYAGGRQYSYLARCDTLTTTSNFDAADQQSASVLPTPFGLDPLVQLSSMLANDQLRDTGTVTVGGRDARRLVGSISGPPVRRDITYLIDEESYEPISATLTIGSAKVPPAQRFTYRYEIVRYERLEETAETRRLLRIQTTDRTRRVYRRLPLSSKQKLAISRRAGCADGQRR
jgi:hypothetical protein